MQTPVIIFDHINGKFVTSTTSGDEAQSKKLAEIMAAQQNVVAGAGRPAH
jgi:hypothetical protein